ncbi:MAG: sigma-70 family RNA polymerase sigma factor [bacterium]|nr:sigma-70 family RNA polymerase sigma factor [bacterium]
MTATAGGTGDDPDALGASARGRRRSPAGRRPAALSDLDLAGAAAAGDREAMEALLRRHYPRLYAVCRRLAGNDADAADAAQEALIAVSRGLRRFDARSSFTTWSYRVATNACLDELRRRRRHVVEPLPDQLGGRADPVGEQISARLDLDAALAGVPEEFRVPVVLRDQAGLSYGEIAEVLGIPPGTVRSRIARGRARLAETLGEGNQTATADRQNSDEP